MGEGLPATGPPATGLPATELPATGPPATGLPATGPPVKPTPKPKPKGGTLVKPKGSMPVFQLQRQEQTPDDGSSQKSAFGTQTLQE